VSLTLGLKSLRLQWKMASAFALGSFFYSFAVMVAFGRFVRYHEAFFVDHLGKDSATLSGFVANWYLGIFWVALLSAFVIFSSSAALAREREEGTLGLLLTYPIGRSGFFLSKLAATICGLAIIIAGTLAGLWAGGLSQHLHLPGGSYLAVAVLGLTLALAIGGIGFLFSAAASRQMAAVWAGLGVTSILYAFHLAVQTVAPLRDLGAIDVFSYFKPSDALGRGLVGIETLALLGVAAVTLTLAGTLFRLKDIRA
jgi:ABC-type transport system involved in multi-copper enzyme maturation permease subunit